MIRKAKNLRISPEADALIRILARKFGISQTGVMEMAIRKLADAEGVERRDFVEQMVINDSEEQGIVH